MDALLKKLKIHHIHRTVSGYIDRPTATQDAVGVRCEV